MPDTPLMTRRLGKSGIEVSALGLGLWSVRGAQWGQVDDRSTFDTIDAALDAGVTFFDPAAVYGNGPGEDSPCQRCRGPVP